MNNQTDRTSKTFKDYAKSNSDFLSTCRPPSYEESNFKKLAGDVKRQLEEQDESIKSIADSAKRQADSFEEQVNNAKQEATNAKRDARFSKIVAVISLLLSVVAIIVQYIS